MADGVAQRDRVACGVDIARALIASQVILSLTLPFPMVAIVWFIGQTRIMGNYAVPHAV